MTPRLDNRPCGGKFRDIVDAIGNTPLVELRSLNPKHGVHVYAKLEIRSRTELAIFFDEGGQEGPTS